MYVLTVIFAALPCNAILVARALTRTLSVCCFACVRDARALWPAKGVCEGDACIVANIKNQFFFVRSLYFKQVALIFFCTLYLSFHSLHFMLYTPIIRLGYKGKNTLFLYASEMPLTFSCRFVLRRSFHELLLPFIICGGRCFYNVCVSASTDGGCNQRGNDAGCGVNGVCRSFVCLSFVLLFFHTIAKYWLENFLSSIF